MCLQRLEIHFLNNQRLLVNFTRDNAHVVPKVKGFRWWIENFSFDCIGSTRMRWCLEVLFSIISDAHKQTPDMTALEDAFHTVQFHICLARESAVEISAKTLTSQISS